MFKFDFNLAEEEVDENLVSKAISTDNQPTQEVKSVTDLVSIGHTFVEHHLLELTNALPGIISYSPLHVPSCSGSSEAFALSKRDLFDARFQLISSGIAREDTALQKAPSAISNCSTDLQYVEAPSDLVPGVYEGGLKTWECSIDLAGCVQSSLSAVVREKKHFRTLELGCGTAVPSLTLLREIFSTPPQPERNIEIHLQDYNGLVFRLVTLPNIILAWYMSPASSSFISTFRPTEGTPDGDQEPLPQVDPTVPGDLPLIPALLDAFQTSLRDYGISLRLFSGPWENFDLTLTERRYDIILTSETIYRTESLASLCDLLWKAYVGGVRTVGQDIERTLGDLEKSTSQLSLHPGSESSTGQTTNSSVSNPTNPMTSPVCFVAAKLVYFGVGGGVSEFTRAIDTGVPSTCGRKRGMVDTIWRRDEGVKRVVLGVHWE